MTLTLENDYTREHAHTAMCLWEAIIDSPEGAEMPWQAYRDANGTATLRELLIDLAPACDAAWSAQDEETRDDQTFDWDFCPTWLRFCVNWEVDHPAP